MVRIINAFREDRPIGAVLANLGQALFGDQAGSEINRQQAYALTRGNVETDNLMRQVSENGGVQALGADPVTQAMLIGSGYAPQDFSRIGLMGAATGEGARSDAATNWTVGAGLPFANTAQAFDQADATDRYGYDTTAATSRANNAATIAENARQFDQTPQAAIVNGQMGFVPRSGAFDTGIAPIPTQTEAQGFNLMNLFPTLTPEQQLTAVDAAPSLDQVRAGVATDALGTDTGLAGLDAPTQTFVGADPAAGGGGTPKNYIDPDGTVHITYDGVTDAQTGVRLTPGGQLASTALQGTAADLGIPTNAVRTDLQSDLIATDKFNDLVGMMLNPGPNGEPALVDQAQNFGIPGWVQSRAQELVQGIGGVVDWIRPQDAAAVREFMPELYNPNLTEVQTLGVLLLYQGAAALAGQQGRSVSDNDVRLMRQAIPNPFGIFTSAQSMRAALETAQQVINSQRAVVENALTNGVGSPPAAAAVPAAPPVTTGTMTPNPDGTFTWTP